MKILFLLFFFYSVQGYDDFSENSNNIVIQKWLEIDRSFNTVIQNYSKPLRNSAFLWVGSSQISFSCKFAMLNFWKGLVEKKTWAIEILDSFGKIPSGISAGSITSLGNYDMCLNANADNLFTGKYCSIYLKVPLPKHKYLAPLEEPVEAFQDIPKDSFILKHLERIRNYIFFFKPRTSVCVPSACSRTDVENLISKGSELFGFHLDWKVINCKSKSSEMRTATYFELLTICFLCSMISLVIFSTIMDVYRQINNNNFSNEKQIKGIWKFFMDFSVLSNWLKLIKEDQNPNSIKIFHGMRVISALWVILGHIYTPFFPQVFDSTFINRDMAKSFWVQFIASGRISVEHFFFMSSVLLAYSITKLKDRNLPFTVVFLNRYVRTFIPQLFMMAITCILPLLASGPLSEEILGHEAKVCKEYGWRNVFHINNFLPTNKRCMRSTWYLSADIQLFTLGIFVLIPFRRKPKLMFYFIGLLFITGVSWLTYNHIVYELPPVSLPMYQFEENEEFIMLHSYLLPQHHLITFSIGLTVGYILATKKELHLSKKMKTILWISSFINMFVVIFVIYIWNQTPDQRPGLFASVLYGSLHRILYSLSLAWITISCTLEKKGFVYRFLGSNLFVPLARVTFMTYLCHFAVQTFYFGSARNTITYNHPTLLYLFGSVSVISFSAGFILTLFFESPIINLQKSLIQKSMDINIGKGK